MKRNLPIVFVVTLSLGLNTQAATDLLDAPPLFSDGPRSPTVIKLEPNEIASLMLLEGLMDISSTAALANDCQSTEGKYSIEISADGAINTPETNTGKISSPGNSEPLVLNATMEAPDSFFGQHINIRQTKTSKLKETQISEYSSVATLNHELTLLSMDSKANILGRNNIPLPHQNLLIKDFYEEQKPDQQNEYILGWGSASLSKASFPTNLGWLLLKALKASGRLSRAVLEENRLIGTSSCRIVIDTSAETKTDNEKVDQKKIVLKGVMTITTPKTYKDNSGAFEF